MTAPEPVADEAVTHGALMPTAAVLAHWRSGWFDMTWREAVDRACSKEAEHMASLTASIREVGIRKPIVLGADGRVWDGNHRLVVACKIGLPTVPVDFGVLHHDATKVTDPCPTCALPVKVHALWCPARPGVPETADDVLRRVHSVFDDPSRAWFATTFWDAFAQLDCAESVRRG